MSTNQKLTPWFRGDDLPVRAGVYQTRAFEGQPTFWRLFDGKQWHDWGLTRLSALREPVRGEPNQWRGLAEDPSKAGAA